MARRESVNCSLWSSTPIRFPTKRPIQNPIILLSALMPFWLIGEFVIRKGRLIIVNGDPTKDIRLLMDAEKNSDLIMKDGKIYKNTIRTESRK